MLPTAIKIIECPRDAMQGIHQFISTEKKAAYINALLKVGFDTIDFGSFVSPKAIPQMRDTAEVLNKLNFDNSSSKLLAIVANQQGANNAIAFDEITYLGFPFSISETFQQRNANSSIAEAIIKVADIQNLCIKHNKQLVVYLSMAFGNPYGEEWNSDIVIKWTTLLADIGIKTIALSDTIGIANPDIITTLFSNLIPQFKQIEIGAHLHTNPFTWKEKIIAAYESGCKRFDTAIKGYGGCPMATEKLTGNMPTENCLAYFKNLNINLNLDNKAFEYAMILAANTFPANEEE